MKKIIVATLVLATFMMVGCGNVAEILPSNGGNTEVVNAVNVQEPASEDTDAETRELQEYAPASGSYTISICEIDGGWTVYPETGNEEQLVLDNEDMSFSILMQSFPKVSDAYQDFASFEEFYRQATASSMGEGTVENIDINNAAIRNYSSMLYTVDSQGYTFYGQITVFETENAYYSCTITGLDQIYKDNIAVYEDLYNTFAEK
ncbi:MAG: hypothetical protein IJD31_10450 [Lachnospiraceae bacterium]|nr:hypothetical protein [Lachnospiraceae bacterium]